MFVPINSLS